MLNESRIFTNILELVLKTFLEKRLTLSLIMLKTCLENIIELISSCFKNAQYTLKG